MRLAEARGSLRAPNSRVQDRALEFLSMLDARERRTQRLDSVRLAVLSSPLQWAELEPRLRWLFPEYLSPEAAYRKAKKDDGSYDIDKVDDGSVEWLTPASADEDAEISAWIEQNLRGTAVLSDDDDGWR